MLKFHSFLLFLHIVVLGDGFNIINSQFDRSQFSCNLDKN